jgi:hypothetical protein
MNDGIAREAARQRWLLLALRGAGLPPDAEAWLAGPPARRQAGLQAYQANAAATARRALAAAYPTVEQGLGDAPFAALAQALWQAAPPQRGDLAAWGDALPAFIEGDDQLAGEPYLADLARLDWAVHLAHRAADDDAPVAGLALLGSGDAARLWLRLRAGHAVLRSAHPVHTLWAAHRSAAADRFADARAALARRQAEAVRIRCEGLGVVVECIDPATAGFEADLLRGLPLGDALDAAAGLAFEPWLIDSLRRGALAAVLQRPPG